MAKSKKGKWVTEPPGSGIYISSYKGFAGHYRAYCEIGDVYPKYTVISFIDQGMQLIYCNTDKKYYSTHDYFDKINGFKVNDRSDLDIRFWSIPVNRKRVVTYDIDLESPPEPVSGKKPKSRR